MQDGSIAMALKVTFFIAHLQGINFHFFLSCPHNTKHFNIRLACVFLCFVHLVAFSSLFCCFKKQIKLTLTKIYGHTKNQVIFFVSHTFFFILKFSTTNILYVNVSLWLHARDFIDDGICRHSPRRSHFFCSLFRLWCYLFKKSLSCHLRALIQYLSISTHGYDLWILWKMCWFNHLHIWYCLRSRISMKCCLRVLSIEKGAENVFEGFFSRMQDGSNFVRSFFDFKKFVCIQFLSLILLKFSESKQYSCCGVDKAILEANVYFFIQIHCLWIWLDHVFL